MTLWLLPGRRQNPVKPYSATLQHSLGYSRTFNPRNLEYHWYPLWSQTLSDLIADIPNLIVAPQFPLWFVPSDDDYVMVEEEEDGDDPEEVETDAAQSPPTSLSPNDDEDSIHEGISVAPTVPEPNAKGPLVDFAILHVMAEPESKDKKRYEGWRITQVNVGLLVEIKRYASRSLKGEGLKRALEAQIGEAIEDLIQQAGSVFLDDEKKQSVLAIAAAGPYWCNATISRDHVQSTIHCLSSNDPSYTEPANNTRKLKWSTLLHLGTAKSNNRLQTIYNKLITMGVLPTPTV
ncbi:hypothetical protein EV424DRAFT_1549898 [Suillus variegatus]|nr:hypothetical protein EV424DRAFT_1549898 [Suillus variegatus]